MDMIAADRETHRQGSIFLSWFVPGMALQFGLMGMGAALRATGIVLTCSGVFQGLGNTRPAVLSSVIRLAIFIPLAVLVSQRDGFELRHTWYVSVLAVLVQAILSFVLVQREMRMKLPARAVGPAAAIAERSVAAAPVSE